MCVRKGGGRISRGSSRLEQCAFPTHRHVVVNGGRSPQVHRSGGRGRWHHGVIKEEDLSPTSLCKGGGGLLQITVPKG